MIFASDIVDEILDFAVTSSDSICSQTVIAKDVILTHYSHTLAETENAKLVKLGSAEVGL